MINKEEVKHIAKLARLYLRKEEIEKYQKELSKILDYIEKLKKVDTEKIEPMVHSFIKENVWREDEVSKFQFLSSKLLELAPETKGSYFKVKKII